ncbi:MAG: hypothetical protein J4472_01305 [DPANN group archaeon]|nr:MAG: hypothetical protein QJ16_C0005G0193 [archaeon GW2011_AR1]MBS3064425.1 hypothetical protein [DPANN group archaeon]HIH52148.1 hypothetical protein [Nanoarchaeota archaeon]
MVEIKKIVEIQKKSFIQLGAVFLIFLLFFIGFFFELPPWILYFLILTIIFNLVFGILFKKREISFNLFLLIFAIVSFVPLLGYIATILGMLLSFTYALIFGIWFFK